MKESAQILKESGLNKTSVRTKVLDLFLQSKSALSLSTIEASFSKLDRVTLYRTLKAFEAKGIVHRAIDGTNHPKYALCEAHCQEHNHHDNHPHFHCTTCERTLCLEEVITPEVKTPKGYEITEVNMILSGVCRDCRTELSASN